MEKIIEFDELFDSMMKSKEGVLWKDSVARFYLNGIEECLKLEKEQREKTYRSKKPVKITITYPKKREAVSIAFRDRVYQRSLNDNYIYPQMTKTFIHDNAACQTGKGTDFAIKRIKRFLSSEYKKHGTDFHVLQVDIKGYCPNMRHDVAKWKFNKGLDTWSYERAEVVLDGQHDGDIGYNPGSQMIQIAGISVLDELDHYIKENLRVKNYIRYMDDMILIHHDKGYLEECYKEIIGILKSIGFSPNENKTEIYHINKGIHVLGFTFHVSVTGKIYMLIDPDNVKHERKKLRKLVNLSKKGKMTRKHVDECFDGWKAHAEKGNTYNVIKRMEEYYEELWKEESI